MTHFVARTTDGRTVAAAAKTGEDGGPVIVLEIFQDETEDTGGEIALTQTVDPVQTLEFEFQEAGELNRSLEETLRMRGENAT